jgi:hypothetical protein
VNRPAIPHLFENDLRRLASGPRPRPLAIDPWVASSLLQKAIRRGEIDLAERAAFTLSRHRGQGIWRRLIAIAFEDVSVGSVDALIQTTTACMSADWRFGVGGELPAYALDKHTALGKAAIHRFARECPAVRNALAAHVPGYRANDAACMAAFYTDATPVARRFDRDGSAELESLGVENDMLKVGVRREGVSPVLEVVRDNLE